MINSTKRTSKTQSGKGLKHSDQHKYGKKSSHTSKVNASPKVVVKDMNTLENIKPLIEEQKSMNELKGKKLKVEVRSEMS